MFAAAVLPAQTITFSPQGVSRIPGLNEVRVYVGAEQPMQVKAMTVVLEGLHQNLRILNYVNLQTYVEQANRRAWQRYIGIGLEVAGWAYTAAQASGYIRIKEAWRPAIPIFTGGLTLTRTILDREYKPVALPSDLMPPLIAVPAGTAVDFAVFTP